MQYHVGDLYRIEHEAKGTFVIQLKKATATYLCGEVVEGVVPQVTGPPAGPGKHVSVFKVRCKATRIEPDDKIHAHA